MISHRHKELCFGSAGFESLEQVLIVGRGPAATLLRAFVRILSRQVLPPCVRPEFLFLAFGAIHLKTIKTAFLRLKRPVPGVP